MPSIIITGCSSGLGYELCKQYLALGYSVIGLSRTKPDLHIDHIPLDLTLEESIQDAATIINTKHRDFSCMINCAGIGDIQNIGAITLENIETMMKVNLLGVMSLYAKLRDNILSNHADMCFIGATIGYKANEYMPAYSVSKRGLRGFIENVRLDVKSTSSRVIGLHPGGLDTQSNIGVGGRDDIISKISGKSSGQMISTLELATYIITTLALPKNIEVSEILVNRK